jgi:DNA invertase Pin-like site-specific DNA recombinase
VFREEGVSGTTESLDRPAWLAMMTEILGNGVRTIIIEKLDRLARNLMVQEATIANLAKDGISLISVAEPDLMATEPTRILMRPFMGALAQYEKSQIVLKLRGARMRRRTIDGRCEGRKPFGRNDAERAALKRMKLLRDDGHSFEKIAAFLNADGVPTRTGRCWYGVVVSRILAASNRQIHRSSTK